MRKVVVAMLLIVLLGVVALEVVTFINILKTKEGLVKIETID